MAVPTIRMDATVEEKRFLDSLRKMAGGVKLMTAEQKKAAKDAKALEKATVKLGREAKRVYEQSKTAAQRYGDKVKMLTQAKKQGILTEKQHAQAVRFTKREMQQAGAAGQRAFGPMALSSIRNIASALGIVGGVAGAVQLVRMEYEKLVEVQQRAKEIALTAATAEIQMLRNLGAETEEQRDKSKVSIRAMAQRLRIPESTVEIAVSTAVSARGGLSIEQAIKAVEPALRIAPEAPATSAALAGAALDIGKQGKGITPEAAIGFTLSFIEKARIVETQKAAIALPRATQAAVLRGGTQREGAALLAALTQSMVDPQGRQSVTAALQVINQLAKPRMVKETARTASDVKQANERMRRLADAPGLMGALDLLQGDPEVRATFLERASFQEKAKASVELLLAGGRVRADVEKFRAELPRAAEAGPIFERKLRVQRGTPLQQTAEFDRAMKATVERLERDDPVPARMGILREQMGPILERAGGARLSTKLMNLEATLTGMSAYLKLLDIKVAQLESPVSVTTIGYGAAVTPRTPTAREDKLADALRETAIVLREMIQQSEQPPALSKPGTKDVNNTQDPNDN